jgi:hypothetical protein
MATRTQNNTKRTIAVLGGGALLVWLLWRGRGRGKGKGSGGDDERMRAPEVVEVWLRGGDRIELNGVSLDLATTVARARAAGVARVFTAGDAREGWHRHVINALREAGVELYVQL